MKPKKDRTAAASAIGRRLHELAIDDEGGDRAEHQPGQHRAAAETAACRDRRRQCPSACPCRAAAALVPAALSAPSIWVWPQAAMFGNDRQHHRRRMLRRRGLERLRADHEADIEKDRQDRDQRHHREQQARSGRGSRPARSRRRSRANSRCGRPPTSSPDGRYRPPAGTGCPSIEPTTAPMPSASRMLRRL